MALEVDLSLLDPHDLLWAAEVDRLRLLLGAPHNPTLFPPHFLKVTFPKIGGQIVVGETAAETVLVGFLFPWALQGDRPDYILRLHVMQATHVADCQQLAEPVARLLGAGTVACYDPLAERAFQRTGEANNGLAIGSPDQEEAQAIRRLQQEIWGSEPDFLYPVDLHSSEFPGKMSLVARAGGRPVAFLFGFRRFQGSALPGAWVQRFQTRLRLESQAMGVHPAHRGQGIATALKMAQAQQACQDGIDVVHWTMDPLQLGNAILNFRHLRAVSFDFYPDYYPFRNLLNQITPSRIGLTWLVNTRRVQDALQGLARPKPLNLADLPTTVRANEGPQELFLAGDEGLVAVEIPANWTDLQRSDPFLAVRWRETSDRIFQQILGPEPGQYMITDVATDGPHHYLLARRVDQDLLAGLSA